MAHKVRYFKKQKTIGFNRLGYDAEYLRIIVCPDCKGSGIWKLSTIGAKCKLCGGSGKRKNTNPRPCVGMRVEALIDMSYMAGGIKRGEILTLDKWVIEKHKRRSFFWQLVKDGDSDPSKHRIFIGQAHLPLWLRCVDDEAQNA